MTAKPDQDKWVAATLPAAAILLAGWWLAVRPVAGEASLMARRVTNQGSADARRDELAQAIRASEAAMTTVDQQQAALDKAPIFETTRAMEKLSTLCAEHSLSIILAKPEPGGTAIPAGLASVSKSTAASGRRVIWKIELTGPYAGVLGLLKALGEGTPMVLPTALTMRPPEGRENHPTWTIHLWI